MSCNCTSDTIDGLNINRMPSWELALRNAAHDHYPVRGLVVEHAVEEIDALRKAAPEVSR